MCRTRGKCRWRQTCTTQPGRTLPHLLQMRRRYVQKILPCFWIMERFVSSILIFSSFFSTISLISPSLTFHIQMLSSSVPDSTHPAVSPILTLDLPLFNRFLINPNLLFLKKKKPDCQCHQEVQRDARLRAVPAYGLWSCRRRGLRPTRAARVANCLPGHGAPGKVRRRRPAGVCTTCRRRSCVLSRALPGSL